MRFEVSVGEKLQAYVDMLVEWNAKINLVAEQSIPYVWQRHIEDSAQLGEYIDPGQPVIDIGSGAGLPGMVLSILGFDVQMTESDQRKCVFLEEVARVCGVKPLVHNMRVENFKPATGGVITARAFAPLPELFRLTKSLGDEFVLLKGENAMAEIEEAQGQGWKFDYELRPSRTGSGFILIIKRLQEKL